MSLSKFLSHCQYSCYSEMVFHVLRSVTLGWFIFLSAYIQTIIFISAALLLINHTFNTNYLNLMSDALHLSLFCCNFMISIVSIYVASITQSNSNDVSEISNSNSNVFNSNSGLIIIALIFVFIISWELRNTVPAIDTPLQ